MVKSAARKTWGMLCCASLLLGLILPGGWSLARAAVEEVGPEPVSVCIGGAPGIPLLLAQEQGAFAAQGVDVSLKRYRTAAEGFEGFFRGECDLSSASETSVVLKSFEHQDFSILATVATSDNSPRILANRKSGIATPQDLKGKRIFVLQWNSNHYFLDMFLAQNGLSENEVRILFTGVPDIAAAFAEGRIDAFCATEVLIDKPLRALGSEAVVFEAPGLCLVSFLLVAKNSRIAARPEMIKKVLTALLRNEEAMEKDRESAVRAAAAGLGIEARTMDGIWDGYKWKVGLSQALLLSLEHEAQWAIDSGFAAKDRIPNYLNFVYRDALLALKPEAVTMLK